MVPTQFLNATICNNLGKWGMIISEEASTSEEENEEIDLEVTDEDNEENEE